MEALDMQSPVRRYEYLVAIFLLLLTAQFAFGDNVYGGIRGIITDPAGAAVPGSR